MGREIAVKFVQCDRYRRFCGDSLSPLRCVNVTKHFLGISYPVHSRWVREIGEGAAIRLPWGIK